MKIFIWASFMVIFFTACTQLASATVYTLPELTNSIDAIEILMDKGSVDFSGDLQQDMDVRFAFALGSLTLEISETINAHVELGGNYQQLTGQGNWVYDGNHYCNPAEGPLLNIFVEMDVGGLNLVLKP